MLTVFDEINHVRSDGMSSGDSVYELKTLGFHSLKIAVAVVIGMPVLESAEIVEYRYDAAAGGTPVFFTAKSSADHLHISNRAEDLASYQQHIGAWGIEACGEHTVVT